MAINPAWRNLNTTLDAKKAKAVPLRKCERCGDAISSTGRRGRKKYCSPCSDIILTERSRLSGIASSRARRAKLKESRSVQ